MSRKKLEQARERLARARQDILQDLSDLTERAADPEAYQLSHEEADQFYREFSAEIDELRSNLAQALTIRTTIDPQIRWPAAGPKDYGGPVPPWRWPPDEDQLRRVLRGFSGNAGEAMPPRSPFGDESARTGLGPEDSSTGSAPPGGPKVGI